MHIPFNKPFVTGREYEYIRQAIAEAQVSGDGLFSRRCHEVIEELLEVKKCLLTTSCTHALEMCAILLDIHPGDEVIVPSFTFVSTVNAFVMHGARPVFADIRPDTLNLDETKLESHVTASTKVIVPVHYAGVGCEMTSILRLAQDRNIALIEDNAHGLFGKYRGRYLGTFGSLATQSFHETKNIRCGEGGALLINDPALIERAEIIREKGTNRSRFFRGQVDKYTWVDTGSSYLPSDMLAAFLLAQLEVWEDIQARRKDIWTRYNLELAGWAKEHGVQTPHVPGHCEQPWHMFYLIMPDEMSRDGLIAHLRHKDILAVFHYLPLHLSPMGKKFGGKAGDCPVTEDVSARLVRLPFYKDLSEEEQDLVIQAVLSYMPGS